MLLHLTKLLVSVPRHLAVTGHPDRARAEIRRRTLRVEALRSPDPRAAWCAVAPAGKATATVHRCIRSDARHVPTLADVNDLPLTPPGQVNDGHQTDAKQRARSFLIHALFATVVLLIAADLHSSYFAENGTWEVNPVMAATAEHLGTRVALVAIKAIDLACLLGMYGLWRHFRCHLPVASALLGIVVVYGDVVLNNYAR